MSSALGRAGLVRVVNARLSTLFRGRLELVEIQHVGLTGASGVRATLQSASGQPLASVQDVRVRCDVLRLGLALLSSQSPWLRVDSVSIPLAEIGPNQTPAAPLGLVEALELNPARADAQAGTRVSVDEIRFEQANVSRLFGSVDVSVQALSARLDIDPHRVELDLHRAELVLRNFAELEAVQGTLTGSLRLKTQTSSAERAPELDARFEGNAADVSVVASIHGALNGAAVELEAQRGQARLHATGTAAFAPTLSTTLRIEARDLDTRTLWPGAPEANLGFHSTLTLARDPDGMRGRLELDLDPSTIAGAPVPATRWVADLKAHRVRGDVRAHEAAANHVSFDLEPEWVGATAKRLRFELKAELPDLAAISARIPGGHQLAGSARVNGKGHLGLAGPLGFEAEIDASLDALATHGVRAQAVRVTGSARGTLWPAKLELEGLTFRLRQGAETLRVTARAVSLRDGSLDVEGVELRGAGRLDASAHIAPGRSWMKATAQRLDLGAISRALGGRPLRGRATFDADLRLGEALDGRLEARLRELGYGNVDGAVAGVQLHFDKGRISGKMSAALARVGAIDLRAEGFALPRAWSGTSIEDDSGTLSVSSHLDLRELQRLGLVPDLLQTVAGEISLEAHSTHEDGLEPGWVARLETRGFSWQPRPRLGRPSLWPRRWQGIDAELVLALTNDGAANLTLQLADAKSELLHAVGHARLPLSRLLGASGLELARMPFLLAVDIPECELGRLPVELQVESVAGRLGARVVLEGPWLAPHLDATLKLVDLHLGSPDTPASKLVVQAGYRDARFQLHAEADSGSTRVLDLRAGGDVGPELFLGPTRPAGPALSAALSADISRFPLRTLAFLGDASLDGMLDGHVELTGLGDRPDGSVSLRLTSLTLARLPGQRLGIEARAEAGQLQGKLDFEQPDGRLEASFQAGWGWRGLALPHLTDLHDLRADLVARDFQLAALQPWPRAAYRKLVGLLSARLDLGVAGPDLLSGQASLRDGVVEIPELGQTFRDVAGRLELGPVGRVSLIGGSARAAFGRVQLEGEAVLNQLAFQAGTLRVRVAEREHIPVTVRGVPIGNAWGHLVLRGERRDTTLALDLHVPSLHLDLPALLPPDVQALDPDSSIQAGTREGDRGFVEFERERVEPTPTETSPAIQMRAHLGQDVWLHRGSDLEARFSGELDARIGAGLSLIGSLAIPEGRVQVQGRDFRIMDSTVTFPPGDAPTNPIVVASARWKGPDSTDVYADFVGPLDTGTLTWRSQPPLDHTGILSMLLFGTPDGQFGVTTGAQDVGAAAALEAGENPLVRGLNRQLRELTALSIQTRLDRSRGSPHPELALQLSPLATAEVTYDLGAPSPGDSPDTTFLTLDLRLQRNWSLSTTVGDQGSTFVDLSWRYRY